MMRFLRAIWRFLFPPSPWDVCHVQTPAERLALRELRLGKHKAELALKKASIAQATDQYTARIASPATTLPSNHGENTVRVVSISKSADKLRVFTRCPQALPGQESVAAARGQLRGSSDARIPHRQQPERCDQAG